MGTIPSLAEIHEAIAVRHSEYLDEISKPNTEPVDFILHKLAEIDQKCDTSHETTYSLIGGAHDRIDLIHNRLDRDKSHQSKSNKRDLTFRVAKGILRGICVGAVVTAIRSDTDPHQLMMFIICFTAYWGWYK